MSRKFLLPLVIAAMMAAMMAKVSDQRGFEELAVRAAVAEEAQSQGAKCPLSPERIDKADIGLLSSRRTGMSA